MTDIGDVPEIVRARLEAAGLGGIVDLDPLPSGANHVARVRTTSGDSVILKYHYGPDRAGPATGRPDFYPCEADGLAAIGATGARVPTVLSVGPDHIVLEDVGGGGSIDFAEAGRAIARMHATSAAGHGYPMNNYGGVLEQINDWTEDGHDFYIRNRLLPLIDDPRCRQVLEVDDLARVERFAARLRDLLPPAPPSLTHGDLWLAEFDGRIYGNVIGVELGLAVIIDPAVSYCWAEIDLSYLCLGGGSLSWAPPDVFFEAYQEIRPLENGWRERFEILQIRSELVFIAHEGEGLGSVPRLRRLLDRYA